MKQSKIAFFEPWFFLFFGLFHLYRIWGLVDRNAYADFWMNVMEQKGAFYYYLCGKSDAQCAPLQVPFSYMQKYTCKNIHAKIPHTEQTLYAVFLWVYCLICSVFS